MKKMLLSVSLIAASTVYAGVEGHVFDQMLPTDGVSRLEAAQIQPADTLALPQIALASPAPTEAMATSEPSAAQELATVAAPAAPSPVLPTPQSGTLPPKETIQVASAAPLPVDPAPAAPSAPAFPPLPRQRPATAPRAAIVAAQSAALGKQAGLYRDGTYTGSSENAYYGRVKVQVVVLQGQVENINVLDYPQDRRTSRYINSQALPMLEREVMRAQTAKINGVSGATLTSRAYIRSLGAALTKAKGGNA